jgi:predicted metal-dependent enzyme (double-stranded beta helix superfamily)
VQDQIMLELHQSPLAEAAGHRLVSATPLTHPLALLMAKVTAACEQSQDNMAASIVPALRTAATTPDLLAPAWRIPCGDCYARHPIYADPAGRFTVLSLVWGPGQFSPPHAHDTWCAYAVVEHALTETLYEFDVQSGKAVRPRMSAREPGYACFAAAGLDQIHRLGNAGGAPAISLHVYGVEGRRVGTHVNRLMDVAGQPG